MRAPGGCHGAVGTAAGVGARTWGAAAGALAHASEVRSSSGEGPVTTAVERGIRFRVLSSERRQLVLLKSLNLVPKSARPNGTRLSDARSNGKAVGGGALTQAQLEAAEAGPAARPNLLPSDRHPASGRMLKPGAGPKAGLRSAGWLPPGRMWREPTTHAPTRLASFGCRNRTPASSDFILKATPASV